MENITFFWKYFKILKKIKFMDNIKLVIYKQNKFLEYNKRCYIHLKK